MRRGSHGRRASRASLALAFVALALLTISWRQVGSLAFVNLGWVRLARVSALGGELRREAAVKAQRAFDIALRLTPRHARAQVGRGVALASTTADEEAIATWRRVDSGGQQLFYLGQDALREGRYRKAIVFLLGAASAGDGDIVPASEVLARKACQRNLVTLDTLGPVGQEYCSTWLSGNDDSLLIDGQFDGEANGWSLQSAGEPASLVRLLGEGRPPPCAQLLATDKSGAILQVLSLSGGDLVRFSGWFRTQAEADSEVSVLVLEGAGSQAKTRVAARVRGETPWRHYTLTYRVPGTGVVDVRAYAAIVRDGDQVWIDALSLEYVDEKG